MLAELLSAELSSEINFGPGWQAAEDSVPDTAHYEFPEVVCDDVSLYQGYKKKKQAVQANELYRVFVKNMTENVRKCVDWVAGVHEKLKHMGDDEIACEMLETHRETLKLVANDFMKFMLHTSSGPIARENNESELSPAQRKKWIRAPFSTNPVTRSKKWFSKVASIGVWS